ncbi:MAG: hypothetical protein WAU15_04875 [Nitrosomonas sp.]
MMISRFKQQVVVAVIFTSLLGCAHDRALIVTKTNVGIDLDTKPPTAEISIARRELAILPSFPHIIADKNNETTLPILASFNLQGKFFNPSIIGHFAGGDAAVNLAQAEISGQGSGNAESHELCLAKEPDDTRGFLLRFWHKLTLKDSSYEGYRNTVRQFYFATDTTFGLKAAWSGTAGPYPDSFKLGYNRKEFASPPIMVNNGCKDNPQQFSIRMPSFFASINNVSAHANLYDSKTNNVQFFATGKAATEFSKRSKIKDYFSENMIPSVTEKTTTATSPINPAQ